MKQEYHRLFGWLAIVAYILVFYYMGHINYHIKHADLALLVMAVMSFLTVFIIRKCGGEGPGPEDG